MRLSQCDPKILQSKEGVNSWKLSGNAFIYPSSCEELDR